MNKTTNVIAAAVMVMTGLGSCATSKQPAAKDADMNASKIVEIEKLDSEYLVLSDAQQSALRSINGMAFDLMRTQAGMDSKVVSPISVSYLMAMLANGASTRSASLSLTRRRVWTARPASMWPTASP